MGAGVGKLAWITIIIILECAGTLGIVLAIINEAWKLKGAVKHNNKH